MHTSSFFGLKTPTISPFLFRQKYEPDEPLEMRVGYTPAAIASLTEFTMARNSMDDTGVTGATALTTL
jgi:hypothetical protein